jgi:hypothetical protein
MFCGQFLILPRLGFLPTRCNELWLENALLLIRGSPLKKICCLLRLFSDVRSEQRSPEVLFGCWTEFFLF